MMGVEANQLVRYGVLKRLKIQRGFISIWDTELPMRCTLGKTRIATDRLRD